MGYKKIHIWEFPPLSTFIRLKRPFRMCLFELVIKKYGSQEKLLMHINEKSASWGVQKHHSRLNLYSWMKGSKRDRGTLKEVNVPLWILIAFSQFLSGTNDNGNPVMHKIEQNIQQYRCWGNSIPITKPKLPLALTPELFSVIFHFLGDGHIGRAGVASSYRQMTPFGLQNVLHKLRNSFGNFTVNRADVKEGKLIIPKVISEFYVYYFQLPNTNTFDSYIPDALLRSKRKFLLAGLLAFIVDEGHIGDVIEIYSKNRRLLEGVREIAISCGYISHPIREKYSYGLFDCYRFSISSKSFTKLFRDTKQLSNTFPTCGFAHKTARFLEKVSHASLL